MRIKTRTTPQQECDHRGARAKIRSQVILKAFLDNSLILHSSDQELPY